MDRAPIRDEHPVFKVARVAEADWDRLRAVRLAALADSPAAFGSDHATEEGLSEDDWREWLRDWPTFLAFHGHTPIGMAAGAPSDKPDERRLIAAWVHPDHRGRSVAVALVEAVLQWARAEGAVQVSLWVTQTNQPAVSGTNGWVSRQQGTASRFRSTRW
jgi:GNAT superfamily N-acetyltransferase